MAPIPMARLSMIAPIVQFLEGIGSPFEKAMEQVHLPLEALEAPETLVPLNILLNFIDRAADGEGIENLGIAMIGATSVLDTGMFGYLIGQSYTLYEALQRTCEISRIAMSESGDKIWLIEAEDHVWFCQQFPFYKPSDIHFDHSVYYSFLLQLDVVRMALGQEWQPQEVHFPTAPCKDLEENAHLWDTRIHFYKPCNAIHIPRHLLSTPMWKPVQKIAAENIYQPNNWHETAPKQDFVGTLEQTLATLLLDSYPTIEVTADAAGISIRTLQRNLSKQGLTYSRMMDKVRYQKALSLMQDADIPLIEVAYAVGFADPANFSHAFKRWTGLSPRQFRRSRICLNPK